MSNNTTSKSGVNIKHPTLTHGASVYILTSSGLCCFNQSLSAASMRVCQPLPVALNALITSDEYRILTGIFGQSVTGRPLRRVLIISRSGTSLISGSSSNIPSGSEATALRIFLSSASVGNIVPGFSLRFGISSNLLFGCKAKTDNSAFSKIIGFGKANRKYSITEVSNPVGNAYISDFAVVNTVIFNNNHISPIKQLCIGKRVTVLAFVGCVFVWIKGDFHVFIVATKNVFANLLHWLAVLSYAYPAPQKTGAGISTPKLLQATPDAASVFFVVRYTRHFMAWCRSSREDGSLCGPQGYTNAHHAAHNGAVRSNRCAGLAPNPLTPMNASRHPIMVTLAGQPQGWPVPCNAGSANPVNVTAPIEISTSRGDSLNLLQEAVYHG